MNEYTPTTKDVRGKYATHQGARYRGKKYLDTRRAEFDRWLEQVKHEAWEEGFAGGHATHVRQTAGINPLPTTENPYRKGADT